MFSVRLLVSGSFFLSLSWSSGGYFSPRQQTYSQDGKRGQRDCENSTYDLIEKARTFPQVPHQVDPSAYVSLVISGSPGHPQLQGKLAFHSLHQRWPKREAFKLPSQPMDKVYHRWTLTNQTCLEAYSQGAQARNYPIPLGMTEEKKTSRMEQKPRRRLCQSSQRCVIGRRGCCALLGRRYIAPLCALSNK